MENKKTSILRLPAELDVEIKKKCKKLNITQNQLIRLLLKKFIDGDFEDIPLI